MRAGDIIDFWRVERVEAPCTVLLHAEMKLPGRAWLQFELRPDGAGRTLLRCCAWFEPKGLLGEIYWYFLYPIHLLIFNKLGLRMSELFDLKWNDIDFRRNEISVTRSIVFQVVGPCKTEASQKPVPLGSRLAEALKVWRDHTKYSMGDDWAFASPVARGKRPYWGECLMRTIIRPAAAKIGITQRIGWHTF
jgi:integrase